MREFNLNSQEFNGWLFPDGRLKLLSEGCHKQAAFSFGFTGTCSMQRCNCVKLKNGVFDYSQVEVTNEQLATMEKYYLNKGFDKDQIDKYLKGLR